MTIIIDVLPSIRQDGKQKVIESLFVRQCSRYFHKHYLL